MRGFFWVITTHILVEKLENLFLITHSYVVACLKNYYKPWRIFLRNSVVSGLKLIVRTQKNIFLFLNQNICCGYSKEPSQWDGSFEHTKHMLKLMGKKVYLHFYAEFFCLSITVYLFQFHIPVAVTLASSVAVSQSDSLVKVNTSCSSNIAYWDFFDFFVISILIWKIFSFLKNSFMITIGLKQKLGPNCLQKLSADGK